MTHLRRWKSKLKQTGNTLVDVASSRGGFSARVGELLAGRFNNELKAVYAGKRAYHRTLTRRGDGGSLYNLRRNIHRLEKGLIMRPRRPVFAAGYITETIERYGDVLDQNSGQPASEVIEYATHVLNRYFEVVAHGEHSTVDAARQAYEDIRPALSYGADQAKAPFLRATTPLQATLPALQELAQRRRSCRWYLQNRHVPHEVIDRAIEVAAQSPSACNRQPFEFRIFDDPAMVQRIAKIPMGTKGFAEGFPCIVAMVGKLRAFPNHRDRHVIYIDASLASMAFIFALEVQGIASCCINWPDINRLEKQMSETLNLAADERVVMLISLGYPDPEGQVPYSQKKNLDELRSYNKS